MTEVMILSTCILIYRFKSCHDILSAKVMYMTKDFNCYKSVRQIVLFVCVFCQCRNACLLRPDAESS